MPAVCVTCRPEVRAFGVSVHLVEPGFHATPLINVPTIQSFSQGAWDRLSANLKEEYPEDYISACKVAHDGKKLLRFLKCRYSLLKWHFSILA